MLYHVETPSKPMPFPESQGTGGVKMKNGPFAPRVTTNRASIS